MAAARAAADGVDAIVCEGAGGLLVPLSPSWTMRSCAVELARYGIHAHSIVAGWTETPLASPRLHDERFERTVMARMPQRRWGEPDDFARLAVYLAGGVGGFHTGDEIVVDGAYSIF